MTCAILACPILASGEPLRYKIGLASKLSEEMLQKGHDIILPILVAIFVTYVV